MNRVYRSDLPELDIPKNVLRAMLETCTKEAPFLSHRGELYRQVDGVAMGSSLGVLFANMYLAEVEERTFHNSPPSGIYARYIDDIFITTTSEDDVTSMIAAFEQNSCLKFTSERSHENSLPFLDVNIKKHENGFSTSVYTKTTNVGRCLNARGECPMAYKRSVVASYVNRALTHCSSWLETHRELDRIRQLLTNNGFSDRLTEETIKCKLDKYAIPSPKDQQPSEQVTIYYQSSFHDRFREESDALKKIIMRGVQPTNQDTKINLRVYCKPNLTRSLFMRNGITPRGDYQCGMQILLHGGPL